MFAGREWLGNGAYFCCGINEFKSGRRIRCAQVATSRDFNRHSCFLLSVRFPKEMNDMASGVNAFDSMPLISNTFGNVQNMYEFIQNIFGFHLIMLKQFVLISL